MRQANLPMGDKVPPVSVQLHHGDCLEVMPTLPDNSVQMVFADLPYQATRCKWDFLVDGSIMWPAAMRVVAPRAAILATADIRLMQSLLKNISMPFRYDMIWHKSRASGFLNAKRAPLRAHEFVLYFSQGPATYHPQMLKDWRNRPPASFIRAKKSDCYGAAEKKVRYVYGSTRYPRSVIEPVSPASERGLHPTQKPVALLEWLIRTYTNEGDTVLDPVMGSGTTGVACVRTGRNFIGIEKDATYFAAAKKRIEAEQAAMADR